MKQYWMILGYDMDILAIWGCGFKILVSLIVSQVIANNLTSFWGQCFFCGAGGADGTRQVWDLIDSRDSF